MNRIKSLRKKAGLSQTSLSNKINVSQQAVAKWEIGAAMPRADKLPELARALGCEIEELYKNEEGQG